MTRLPFGKLYWLVAQDYSRTEQEFLYIQEFLDKLGWSYEASKRVDPGIIQIAGGFTIETKSAQDSRKLAAKAPDGVLICEASQVDYEAYLRSRGRVAEKRGWVMMSGCLVGDTLIPTSKGLFKISELVGESTHKIDLQVSSLPEKCGANLAFYNGESPTVKVYLDKGFALEGTPDHKIVSMTPQGIEWVELKNLQIGQLVPVVYGTNHYGSKHYDLDEAYLAGLYIAEGSWEGEYKQAPRNGHKTGRRSSGRITFTNTEPEIIEQLKNRKFTSQDEQHWRKADKRLSKFFNFIGIDPDWKAHTKEIPISIRESDRKTQIAFLQGLFDGDGTATNHGVNYRTVSLKLAKQVQAMLLNIGVVSCLTEGYYKSKYDGQKRYICDLNIYDTQVFAKLVGFRLRRKQLAALKRKKPKFLRNQARYGAKLFGSDVAWCRVKSKEEGFSQTYDLHVPVTHCYVANGIWVHNTFESSLGWY